VHEPSVYIIILNWNGGRDTIESVESCRRLTYPNFRILIVDNGSTDGSEAFIREKFPDQEIIQTGANLGFAGGNNTGVRYAIERRADYVWLLNNDATVAPDALAQLVRTAGADERIGMVGSKIVYSENSGLLWYAGANLDFDTPWLMHHRGLGQEDTGQYGKVEETGFVTGCSLLARREMLLEIGLMDENFFLYFEDSDLSVRAKKAGWKLFYCPASRIYHKVSLSVGGADSPVMLYYYSRNFLYFVNKNFPEKFTQSLLHDFFEHVLVNVKKRKFACAAKAMQGIYHYFTGKKGPLQGKAQR